MVLNEWRGRETLMEEEGEQDAGKGRVLLLFSGGVGRGLQ